MSLSLYRASLGRVLRLILSLHIGCAVDLGCRWMVLSHPCVLWVLHPGSGLILGPLGPGSAGLSPCLRVASALSVSWGSAGPCPSVDQALAGVQPLTAPRLASDRSAPQGLCGNMISHAYVQRTSPSLTHRWGWVSLGFCQDQDPCCLLVFAAALGVSGVVGVSGWCWHLGDPNDAYPYNHTRTPTHTHPKPVLPLFLCCTWYCYLFSFQMVMYLFISAYYVVLCIVIFVMIVYNYCNLTLLLFISEYDVSGCCFCSSALLCLLPYSSSPCPFLYCVFTPLLLPGNPIWNKINARLCNRRRILHSSHCRAKPSDTLRCTGYSAYRSCRTGQV